MASTMRARRVRGGRRRMGTRRLSRRSGRKLRMGPIGTAARVAAWRAYRNRFVGPMARPRVGKGFFRKMIDDYAIGAGMFGAGVAAGRLRMDTPTTSRAAVKRRASEPGSATRPYGSLSQGRPYAKRRVSFRRAVNSLYGGVSQMTRSYKKVNRPKPVITAIRKLQKTEATSIGGIWQMINPLNAPTAALPLTSEDNANSNVIPIHVYRLDDQISPSAASSSNRAIAYATLSPESTNNITFAGIPGDNLTPGNNGRTMFGYQFLWATNDGAVTHGDNYHKTVLRHVKVDIMFRGIRTRPTTFKVQFVQFKREAIAPEHNWTVGTLQDEERTRFWTQMAKPLVSHPLANNPRDFNAGEYMTVLKTYYKTIQPDTTINADTTPLQHRMTIKYNFNRLCDYTERAVPPAADIDQVFVNEPEQFFEHVNPNIHGRVGSWKARVYMIISATINSGPQGSADNLPQYDISIRPVHTVIE